MVSLIITIFNEEKNITNLFSSISRQTLLPNEVVIVDAESTDKTYEYISDFSNKHPELHIKLIKKAGNRSIGRNIAITNSQYPIIACTDAGCLLDENWVKNIVQPFASGNVDVVGGWYETIADNTWNKSLTKVFNFSAKKVCLKTFLPSARSIAFTKKIWEKTGGFDPRLSHNEDTPFAIKLHGMGARFAFANNAIVHWHAVKNFRSLYHSIYRYAYGDGQARVYTSQYRIIALYFILLIFCFSTGFILPLFWIVGAIIFLAYLFLPIMQAKRLDNIKEIYLVPTQKLVIILADAIGFIKGLLAKL